MTVKEAVTEKLEAMPAYRQQEVLDFVEFLEAKMPARGLPLRELPRSMGSEPSGVRGQGAPDDVEGVHPCGHG